MPSADRYLSTAFWNGASTAVIHTLKPMTPALPSAWCLRFGLIHPDEHRGQAADGHRCAFFFLAHHLQIHRKPLTIVEGEIDGRLVSTTQP